MTIKVSGILSHNETVDRHAQLGWQCPECYGIQINNKYNRFHSATTPVGFECQECGNYWSKD